MSTGACQDLWLIIPWFVKSQISCTDFLCIAPRQGKMWKKNKYKPQLFRQKSCFQSFCYCLVPSTSSASMWLMSLLGSCIGKAEGKVPNSVMEAALFGASHPSLSEFCHTMGLNPSDHSVQSLSGGNGELDIFILSFWWQRILPAARTLHFYS